MAMKTSLWAVELYMSLAGLHLSILCVPAMVSYFSRTTSRSIILTRLSRSWSHEQAQSLCPELTGAFGKFVDESQGR